MWIRTQEKIRLINLDSISDITIGRINSGDMNRRVIRMEYKNGEDISVGIFINEERTLKIINEISNTIQNNRKLELGIKCGALNYYDFIREYVEVYQIPSEVVENE